MSDKTAARGEAAWNQAIPLDGTLGQVYLMSRGINITPGSDVVRFLPAISHPTLKQNFPATIARVNGGAEASHQFTYLAPDGKSKAAVDKSDARRTFGSCKGGAVRLAEFVAGKPLLAGEGIESALTGMEATGLPGWASLGASNLPNIPWPKGATIICLAENDDANRKALNKACPKVIEQGCTVLIATPPAGCKDHNDLVRNGLDRASGLMIAKMTIDAAQPWTPPKGAKKEEDPEDGNFSLSETGLYLRKNRRWNWIAQPFEVLGLARDEDSARWGKLIRFVNADGITCSEVIVVETLHRDLGAAIAPLLDHGMDIKCTVSARQSFAEYLASTQASDRVTTAHRIGWHEIEGRHVFVIPDEIIAPGANGEIMLAKTVDALYARRGDLAGWKESVAQPAGEHRMLRFSIAVAFAGSLLLLGGFESGLFHLHGRSSEGKTTCLRCGASVWGSGADGGYMRAWRVTLNGLEAMLAAINDTFLPLDEVGQAEGRELGPMIYMITGSVGKTRMRRDATLKPSPKWRVLGLSSGEVPIAARLDEETKSGRRAHAGQLVRALDISAKQTLGLFDRPYVDFDPRAFADKMKHAASTFYGAAGPAFVRALVERQVSGDSIRRRVAEFVAAALQAIGDAHGQAARAAERFGLVAAAAEFAQEFGIVDWREGSARQDALALFAAWLEARGGADAAEVRQIVAQVRRFLEAHGDARFDDLDPLKTNKWGDEQERRPVINRAGYRKGEGDNRRWLVLPEVFTSEICAGFDPREAVKVLSDLGMLEREDDRNYTQKLRLPGAASTQRFYVLTPSIFEGWGES